jgi:hypothetical protein
MKLKEIKNQNLTDWQLMPVYSMELKHDLWGYFPLITKKKVVVCINKQDLKSIWEKLKPCEVKVSEDNCMVNISKKLIIPVSSPQGDEASSDSFLLITDDILKHLQKTKFEYASGLLSFKDETNCKFPN